MSSCKPIDTYFYLEGYCGARLLVFFILHVLVKLLVFFNISLLCMLVSLHTRLSLNIFDIILRVQFYLAYISYIATYFDFIDAD